MRGSRPPALLGSHVVLQPGPHRAGASLGDWRGRDPPPEAAPALLIASPWYLDQLSWVTQ